LILQHGLLIAKALRLLAEHVGPPLEVLLLLLELLLGVRQRVVQGGQLGVARVDGGLPLPLAIIGLLLPGLLRVGLGLYPLLQRAFLFVQFLTASIQLEAYLGQKLLDGRALLAARLRLQEVC